MKFCVASGPDKTAGACRAPSASWRAAPFPHACDRSILPVVMPNSVTCSGCGSAVPVGDRFCGTCGNPITGSALLSGEAGRFDPWVELLQKLRAATLGEYEIKGELGRGGMAAVFLAHDLQLNRRVAIKVMLPGLTYGERMWDRFLAEARTAAKLDHPHIVYIHSVKEKDRFLYFVMKHIDGRSLDDLLSQQDAFPVHAAQRVLAEVAGALDYAHREGVIHRDVKPANIMVDQKGSSIVMDFGIARATDTQHFTQTGATIGTPAYMSPEQCHGSETSAASDQYSLGILAYELLTGTPPFTGTPIELQIAHMQDAPVPIRERRSDLSLELSGAVTRMLQKNPADRWPSLHELVPIFSRGLELLGDAPREELIKMVQTGAPRRRTFPATPISPVPFDSAKTPSVSYPANRTSDTVSFNSGENPPPRDSSPAQEALTQVDGQRASPPSTPSTNTPPDVVWESKVVTAEEPGPGSEAAAPRAMSARTATVVSIGVVLVVVGALALRGMKKGATATTQSTPTSTSATAPVAVAPAPAPAAPVAPTSLPGDSTAIGLGTPLKPPARGKIPRPVTSDAVALLQLTLPKPRATVGDTMHVRLDAMDDAGKPVTTPQIYWSTSDPRVVRFAGPAQVIAVREGKAMITVSAGSSTAAKELIVVAKKK
jgi:eukaryotic-like serine/threonine-protein kinase